MMNRTRTFARLTTTAVYALTLGLGLTATVAAPAAATAQDRGPVQRVVKGKVSDRSGAPIVGAVVYLKDGRSSSVKSAITTDDGSYRFVQLSQSTDYELWAQVDQKKSKTKSISSFDSKNEFIIGLTID